MTTYILFHLPSGFLILICSVFVLAGSLQVFTAAFFICALVVASIDNAGFNVVLTGLLLGVWEVGAMWLLKRGPHETSVRASYCFINPQVVILTDLNVVLY